MFPLFGLPGELREIIYGHCLIVGRVYPYLETHRQDVENDLVQQDAYYHDAPNVSLLLACKKVRCEAEHLLYKRNTFIMPTSSLTVRFFENSMATTARRSWLKSVELSFKSSDLDKKDKEIICGLRLGWYEQYERAQRLRANPPSASHFLRIYGKELHQERKAHLVSISWPRKLAPILNYLELDELLVDIGCSKCEDDCCTMYASALVAFLEGFALAVPKKLQIFGLLDAANEDYTDSANYEDVIVYDTIKRWSEERGCPGMTLEKLLNIDHDGDAWVFDDQDWERLQVGKWGP